MNWTSSKIVQIQLNGDKPLEIFITYLWQFFIRKTKFITTKIHETNKIDTME